jgi:hypothetical protein
MNADTLYNTLEIPGSFLVPGFSIYVLEIIRCLRYIPVGRDYSDTLRDKKWFYIGMTGDPFYPSARAAFHRISGHLELSRNSTQNQLIKALKEKVGIKDDKDFEKITIKMHHFPIDDYKKLTKKQLNISTMQQLKKTTEYQDYKKLQQQVLALENALIYKLKNKLLHKTDGIYLFEEKIPYPKIYKSIIGLVNNE